MACMEGYIITLITFLHFPFSNVSSRCLHNWTKNCINYNSFDFLRYGFSMVSPWHFYQSTKSHTNCICLAFVQCSMTPVTPETPRLPRLRDSRGFCHITFQFSFISDLQQKNLLDVTQLENCSQCHPVSKFWAKLQFMVWDRGEREFPFPEIPYSLIVLGVSGVSESQESRESSNIGEKLNKCN